MPVNDEILSWIKMLTICYIRRNLYKKKLLLELSYESKVHKRKPESLQRILIVVHKEIPFETFQRKNPKPRQQFHLVVTAKANWWKWRQIEFDQFCLLSQRRFHTKFLKGVINWDNVWERQAAAHQNSIYQLAACLVVICSIRFSLRHQIHRALNDNFNLPRN